MTRVSDQSRYDGTTLVDNADAYWVNCQDPQFAGKCRESIDLGKPWGPYGWVDPGDGGGSMQRLADSIGANGLPLPPMGYALDYEEAGVAQVDLVNALDRAEDLHVFDRTMVYTYLYIIGSISGVLRGRPLWLAYYPAGDSSYADGYSDTARNWGALLHQFTSGWNGRGDMSVVVDDAAWTAWIGGVTPVIEKKVVDGMWIVEKRDGGAPDQYWEPAAGGCIQLSAAEAYGRLAAGVPHIELPTLGLISYGLRLGATLRQSIPASSGVGGAAAPTKFNIAATVATAA